MNIIRQSFEIINPELLDKNKILKILELIGRTCYKSEDRIAEGTDEKFIKMLIDAGHEAMIEHWSFSVKFITCRSMTHELVRHRIASLAQCSQRYVNYCKEKHGAGNISFIIPPFFKNISPVGYLTYVNIPKFFDENKNIFTRQEALWVRAMSDAECYYNDLILNGCKPEEARTVLPNSTQTEIVVTANLREWRHILKLRTSKRADPHMRDIMVPLLIFLQNRIPVIFDDITVN